MDRRGGTALATALTALFAGVLAWTPLSDRDWPWHLADFERMAREHALPWQDCFSWASDRDFVPVHWIFELVLGLAHRALGLAGIELVRVLLVAATFALLKRLLAKRGLGPVASSGLALTVAALTRGRLLERPHLVTLLGMVVLWDQLLSFRDARKKRLLALVPLFALWANMHPGVVYGAIFATGFAAASVIFRRERAIVPWVALGLLATLATPYGPRLYPYLLEHRALQAQMHIAELRPIDWKHAEDFSFTAAVLLATLIFIRGHRSGVRIDPTELLAPAGFLVLACVAAREANLALIAIAVTLAPVLADAVKEAKGELEGKDRGLHVFAWSFALVLGFGFPIYALASQVFEGDLGGGIRAGAYPEREADWILANRPHGKLWNTNASGGYLIYRLDPLANPDWKVFTDGRQPLFGHAVNMLQPEIDTRFHPNIYLNDTLTAPYDTTDLVKERFALVHFSDGGRTYLRRDGPDKELIARFAFEHLAFCAVKDPTALYGFRLAVAADSEHLDLARQEALRALAEDPQGHWTNVALAVVLWQSGDKQGAVAAAKRALLVKKNKEALEIVRAFEGG